MSGTGAGACEGTFRARFEEKFVPEPNTGCFLWFGARTARGYGRVRLNGNAMELAHRASWLLRHGALPPDVYVCHRCDTPECVNPDHLFLGTSQQNTDDKIAKGRERYVTGPRADVTGIKRGVEQWNAKLTDDQVAQIRARYTAGGISQQRLADEYGVSQTMVGLIVRGKNWKHVDGGRQ